MNKLNLILHCGGSKATRDDIAKVKTPSPEGRWFPIGHLDYVNRLEGELHKLNMKVVNESFGLSNEGNRMFGLLQIGMEGQNSNDYSWVAGIRNSHDKTFPAGLCVGSGVFVCDNLAFSSEITLARKHTTNIMRDLPMLVTKATGLLAEKWDIQNQRIEAYKNTEITNKGAAWLLLNALRQSVFPKTKIDDILTEWLEPRHPEFKDRNVWSLFNCVTEHLKPRETAKNSIWDLPARTTRLHSLCDSECRIDFSDLKSDEVVEV